MNLQASLLSIPLFLLCSAAQCNVKTDPPEGGEVRVTLVHFSDYHSHAVPYFSEHQPDQGGVARAVGYLKQLRAERPDALLLSGGDMINAGTPAWSDKYRCAEWPWFNDLVDVMALGNHDMDYGWDAFAACQQLRYPVISGNLVDPAGEPVLRAAGGKPYVVKQVGPVRVGIFALAGADFPRLVKAENLPPGARFSDGVEAARRIVRALREEEQVQAVVFIGHQAREDDFAMAEKVPGIDVILGSHSHYKGEFQKIPNTGTYFISPYQYLNYLSQVEIYLRDGQVVRAEGRLLRVDQALGDNPALSAEVQRMQGALEQDPKYAPRFQVIGQAAVELSNDNLDRGESVLGNFVMDIVGRDAPAQAAISSASSFRAAIPPGNIRLEDYLTALPYKNNLLVYRMSGAQVLELLNYSLSKRRSDNFGVTAGLRYRLGASQVESVEVAVAPGGAAYERLQEGAVYSVATTDYLGNIAAGYKDIFARAAQKTDTGKVLNDQVIDYIKKNSPVRAQIEGRIRE